LRNLFPKYLREFSPAFCRIFFMNLLVSKTCTLPASMPRPQVLRLARRGLAAEPFKCGSILHEQAAHG
jgi:hypothetical protein